MANETRRRRRRVNRATPFRPYRVLLPLASLPKVEVLSPQASLSEAEVLLPLAEVFARERRGQLIILHVVTVPEGRSLSEAAAEASRSRQTLDRLLADRGQATVQVKTMVRVAREVWEGIWETVEREEVDLLLLGWRSEALPETAVGDPIDPRLAAPPCNVVVVHLAAELAGPKGWQEVRSVLLPVRGGPHSALALRVAQALAEFTNATITLLHATGQIPRDAEERLFTTTFAPALHRLERLTRSVVAVGDVSQAIIEEAGSHQVVVMGAPAPQVDSKD